LKLVLFFVDPKTSELVLMVFQSGLASRRSRIVQEHCPSTRGNTLACTEDRLSVFLIYSEY
jgi:hypothetical protein